MTLCSMYFNDVNFALGLMFAAFNGAGSAPSGCAPEVFHSRVFHPYYLVPRFPLLRFPPLSPGASFSTPAFSTLATWCRVFHSRIFHSRVFSAPVKTLTVVSYGTEMRCAGRLFHRLAAETGKARLSTVVRLKDGTVS